MRRPGEVLSRLHLLEHAWDFAYENRSNVVDVYVGRLRRKIDEPFGRESLETVRGAGYRLRATGRMSRLPIRVRVTAAFALAMAVVLAGYGAVPLPAARARTSRSRSTASCSCARRTSRRSSASRGASLARDSGGRLVERGESYAQLLAPSGRVLDATRPLGRAPLLTPAELRRARAGADLRRQAVACPVSTSPRACSRRRSTRGGRPLVLVVGATRQDRAETLASFRDELLIAGPIALVLASGVGYLLAGLVAAPGRVDAPPRRGDLRRHAGRAAARAADRRRAASGSARR